jgi:large subunit ribosomal protein L15
LVEEKDLKKEVHQLEDIREQNLAQDILKKIGFEGGQQPLQRRVPKFGFTSPNRIEYNGVNIDTIEALVVSKKLSSAIVKQDLIDNGLIQKNDLVKILGRGKLSAKIDITANAFSNAAKAAIEKAGGTATII